jgi:hypothetical protein
MSGSEFAPTGFLPSFRPMGMISRIRDTFSRSLVGTRVRVGLNSMGAVVWYEIVYYNDHPHQGPTGGADLPH